MNPLGDAILVAMRDQGWLIMVEQSKGLIAVVSPVTGETTVFPSTLFSDERLEGKLRYVLMALVVAEGLQWPWPPGHVEGVHGEQPMSE